jgi:hypothetical protein
VCCSINAPADIAGERLHSVIAITLGLPSTLGVHDRGGGGKFRLKREIKIWRCTRKFHIYYEIMSTSKVIGHIYYEIMSKSKVIGFEEDKNETCQKLFDAMKKFLVYLVLSSC